MTVSSLFTNVFLLAPLFLIACASVDPIPIMSAVDANDQTLIHSSCEKYLGRGIDVCRVILGSKIDSKWRIYTFLNRLSGGIAEIRIRSGDKLLTYTTSEPFIDISWKEITESELWISDLDRPYQALMTVRYSDGTSRRMLGHAFMIVLKPGYTPLNMMESGEDSECSVKVDSSGRSAWLCH